MLFDFVFLEQLALIEAVRFSRWGYAAVNTLHLFGIALLVGGAIPMSLRLLGVWGNTLRSDILQVLVVTTASGLLLAVLSGSVLFATRASEYAANPALQIKLLFVAAGTLSALFAHARYGRTLERTSRLVAARIAGVSIICWICALAAGRLIAFVEPVS